MGETLRAALDARAVAEPGRLRAAAAPDRRKRCDRGVEDMRLPEAGSKREADAAQVGTDAFVLLDALCVDAPTDAAALPQGAVLRRVWARRFEQARTPGQGTAPQEASGPPARSTA